MNSPTKILVPLLLLAALVAGSVFFLQQDDRPSEPAPAPPTNGPVVAEPAPAPVDPRPVFEEGYQPDSARTEIHAPAGTDLPQGVTGRVLAPSGEPLPQASVFLLQSSTAGAIEIYLRRKSGEVIPPVASGSTDAEGRFRLGVARPGQTFDVRVVTDDFPELHHRGVRIQEQDWYDAGDLKLEQGLMVHGRVTEELSHVPVAGAQVYLQSTNAAHTLLPTPGREKGVVVETDNGGFYRFRNAPSDSTISLAVEAADFARVERRAITLQPAVPNEINIELSRGLSILGIVVNAKGQPVPDAQITAAAISSKLPQTAQATTDREGRFELVALRDGPFQLIASAPHYEERVEKAVLAGADDVRLVLEQRGAARVRVVGRNGAPIRDFTVSLKRSFPDSPLGIGNVPEFRDVRVTPRDFDGDAYLVRGIPNGEFVFQIQAAGHARTLSTPFTVVAGGAVPDVTVQMTLGGVLIGRVLDDRGAGVPGATVSTDASGSLAFAGDSEFLNMFKQFMPDRVTKTSVTTDDSGNYRIPMLAYGDYMVRASHRDFCETFTTEIRIDRDADVEVPPIRLSRGTVIFGFATVDGVPQGQIKIQIGPPQNQQQPGQPPPQATTQIPFTASVITDSEGRYRFLKRVPPGTYAIHASKEAGEIGPFEKIIMMKQTSRELIVLPGQDSIEQNFNVLSPR